MYAYTHTCVYTRTSTYTVTYMNGDGRVGR